MVQFPELVIYSFKNIKNLKTSPNIMVECKEYVTNQFLELFRFRLWIRQFTFYLRLAELFRKLD